MGEVSRAPYLLQCGGRMCRRAPIGFLCVLIGIGAVRRRYVELGVVCIDYRSWA